MVKRFRYDGDDETIREDADGEWVLAVDCAKIEAALVKYGKHLPSCQAFTAGKRILCSCGFSKELGDALLGLVSETLVDPMVCVHGVHTRERCNECDSLNYEPTSEAHG